MEAVVAIKMVVTAIIKAITTRVAIMHLKETNKDPSAVNDQTPEVVEQETTITTTTNSSAKMINIAGTCPTRRCKREEGDGKSTKEVLLQAKCRRKRAQTRSQKRRSKFRRRNLRFNPNTKRSRHCRV